MNAQLVLVLDIAQGYNFVPGYAIVAEYSSSPRITKRFVGKPP
jgi:hypothetical protein